MHDAPCAAICTLNALAKCHKRSFHERRHLSWCLDSLLLSLLLVSFPTTGGITCTVHTPWAHRISCC